MLDISRSSEKTRTPGALVASCMSFAAAAPFADLAMRRKGSNFALKLVPKSILSYFFFWTEYLRNAEMPMGEIMRTCLTRIRIPHAGHALFPRVISIIRARLLSLYENWKTVQLIQ